MKKNLLKRSITLLFILVFLFSGNMKVMGQKSNDVFKNSITFGVTHAFNLSTIAGSFPTISYANVDKVTESNSARLTLDLGMTVDYHFSKLLSLQLDLVYSYTGSRVVTTNYLYNEIGKLETTESYMYTMDYFKFPLTLNFYPKEQIYINAGGYFSTLIASKKYDQWFFGSDRLPIDNINPIDYGITAGVGVNLPVVKIGFQYSYGISSFINETDYSVHNSLYQLVVHWKFYSDIRKKKNTL